jgi:hypothetical protein
MTRERQTLETNTAKMWLDDEGTLWGVMKPGADETLADAQANVEAAATLAAGNKVPVIIDMRGVKAISREARNHYGGQATAEYSLAQALVVDSVLTRTIANFTIGLSSRRFPVRLFNSEAQALEWLKEMAAGAPGK